MDGKTLKIAGASFDVEFLRTLPCDVFVNRFQAKVFHGKDEATRRKVLQDLWELVNEKPAVKPVVKPSQKRGNNRRSK